jgi:nucleotide-binding universal stress UspA family protein
MFDEVIVAVDDDEAALDALALGKILASPVATLTLAHVEADGSDRADASGVDTGPARHMQPPRPLVSLSDEDGGGQLPFVVVTATSTAAGLHDLAWRRAADVLVIGASRRVAFERALGRDTARTIIEHTPCAVAVAPPGYAGRTPCLETIGVGYDGSLASEQALEAARRLAAERRAKLMGFEAVTPRPARDPFDAPHEIDQRVAAARRRLAALGDVEPHAEYGGRAAELARFGASVDLLVIGPRDEEDESVLRLAPLAARLAHHAPCPLLVVARLSQRAQAASASRGGAT